MGGGGWCVPCLLTQELLQLEQLLQLEDGLRILGTLDIIEGRLVDIVPDQGLIHGHRRYQNNGQ